MFSGFSDKTIDFMWNIRFNNERSWFLEHKSEYIEVLSTPMNELALEVYEGFAKKHPELSLNMHVSRIYRDARHLHGLGPYKDHLWFTLRRSSEEWTDKPVFWFELSPDNWSYGLGYYRARPLTMLKHRARIDNDPAALEKLARSLNRQNEFVLEGESYARPKGDPGKLLYDWYNIKSFSLVRYEALSEELYSPKLKDRIVAGFEYLVPFYEYFSTLDGDPDPTQA